jgi:osmotically inducible protein OsmC
MANLERKASAVWKGDLRGGNGTMSSTSGVFKDAPFSFATRFEQSPGTNPEELIAAAHAGCYSMAFANTLASKGYKPESIETQATITGGFPVQGAGFKILSSKLVTRGKVAGIDEATFKQIALDAEKTCPVSNALRNNLEIEVDASLI